ncbi:Uncharacterized membrane protein [Natronorubrum sediminis]|uniref:Uncharacterized membrane protein n=1 Tax=Natronorubrum sediminis TaxID=640943 RepID=A0A1H6G517_9EURY|nr:DMT family transporter [Natronorubrum sediminis]SEH18171.1 Uncharacterized membrane protein [Natronorubrum sediminis]
MFESTHVLAVVLALGAAIASASQTIFVRIGTEDGTAYDAVIIVIAVNMIALVPLVAVLYYPDYGLTRVSWLSFIAAGLSGTMFGRIFLYTSIERIGASRTAPIIASWALIASVLGVLFLDESLSPIHAVGIVLIVLGVSVIAWETGRENPDGLSRRELAFGIAIPFVGAFAFGLEPIFANWGFNEGTPAPVGLAVKTVVATGCFWLYLRWHDATPDRSSLRSNDTRWFVFAGIASTLFLLGYYVGLELAPVSVVVPIVVTNTLFVVVLSSVFLSQRLERVTWTVGAAALVVVVGVILITIYG